MTASWHTSSKNKTMPNMSSEQVSWNTSSKKESKLNMSSAQKQEIMDILDNLIKKYTVYQKYQLFKELTPKLLKISPRGEINNVLCYIFSVCVGENKMKLASSLACRFTTNCTSVNCIFLHPTRKQLQQSPWWEFMKHLNENTQCPTFLKEVQNKHNPFGPWKWCPEIYDIVKHGESATGPSSPAAARAAGRRIRNALKALLDKKFSEQEHAQGKCGRCWYNHSRPVLEAQLYSSELVKNKIAEVKTFTETVVKIFKSHSPKTKSVGNQWNGENRRSFTIVIDDDGRKPGRLFYSRCDPASGKKSVTLPVGVRRVPGRDNPWGCRHNAGEKAVRSALEEILNRVQVNVEAKAKIEAEADGWEWVFSKHLGNLDLCPVCREERTTMVCASGVQQETSETPDTPETPDLKVLSKTTTVHVGSNEQNMAVTVTSVETQREIYVPRETNGVPPVNTPPLTHAELDDYAAHLEIGWTNKILETREIPDCWEEEYE